MPGTAPLCSGSDEGRTFTIGELADEFGLTLRTIRHYEDEGLLAPRRDGLNRIYDHRDRARLVLICRGKRLGFRLTDIKDFLNLYDGDDGQVEQIRHARKLARRRIAALESQLADVQQTLAELRGIEAQITRHLHRNGNEDPVTREDQSQ